MRESSKKAYARNWAIFTEWCIKENRTPLPATPQTICDYLSSLASNGNQYKTVSTARTVIAHYHDIDNIASHASNKSVWSVMREIEAANKRPPQRKVPLTVANVRAIVDTFPNTPRGLCNKAIILVFFSGALPRGKIDSLTAENITWSGNSAIIDVVGPEGHFRQVKLAPGDDISTCPVAALRAWLRISQITSGYIFRAFNGKTMLEKPYAASKVTKLVKDSVQKIGLDPRDFGSHSLRSGLALAALQNESSISDVRDHLGITSLEGMHPYLNWAQDGKGAPSSKVKL